MLMSGGTFGNLLRRMAGAQVMSVSSWLLSSLSDLTSADNQSLPARHGLPYYGCSVRVRKLTAFFEIVVAFFRYAATSLS